MSYRLFSTKKHFGTARKNYRYYSSHIVLPPPRTHTHTHTRTRILRDTGGVATACCVVVTRHPFADAGVAPGPYIRRGIHLQSRRKTKYFTVSVNRRGNPSSKSEMCITFARACKKFTGNSGWKIITKRSKREKWCTVVGGKHVAFLQQ